MNMSKKQQQELDGFERDTIPELDVHCVDVCKSEIKKKKATDKLKQDKANLDAKMIELRDAGKLEKSGDHEHTYVFMDGETSRECFIRDSTEIGFRNHKRPTAEGPDLTVVDGGEIE